MQTHRVRIFNVRAEGVMFEYGTTNYIQLQINCSEPEREGDGKKGDEMTHTTLSYSIFEI